MTPTPTQAQPEPAQDSFAWLEEVSSEPALAWVRERNAASLLVLQARPEYAGLHQDFVEVLNAKDRIPRIERLGPWLMNLWQDEHHKRGLWRRTSLEEYRKAEPQWETVLDLDALGAAEQENWVFAGASHLGPDYRRCLISLSRGGADASVVREFDLHSKTFIADGFTLPEAKSLLSWIDADHVFVGTDFGPGSVTDSGYPRLIKRWARGTPLASAKTVFEVEAQDVLAWASVDHTPGFERCTFVRAIDFYNQESFLLQADGSLAQLELPRDMQHCFWGPRLLLQPRSDWEVGEQTFPAGSLLITDAANFLQGQRQFLRLFEPTASRSLAGYTLTRQHVLLNVSEHVASRLEEWCFADPLRPTHRDIQAPFPGALSVSSLYDNEIPKDELADSYLLNYADLLTPDTLFLCRAGSDERSVLKARQAQFDSAGMRTEQFFAISTDGSRVPYFVVWPAGARADGRNPTLMYGYGGFESSLQPWYSAGFGRAWLGRGGVLVLANIRGGGEYGPGWHQAAVKAHKQRSFDDFIAVAEDLIARQISSPQHLGIMGGSNGGLLVGATFVQRPELFGAVVCQVPLLDMRRYHRLLAGASWMAEYGDPDQPEDWAFISRYSPYHNVKPERTYPKVLFTTSSRDDRVHPAHARKMAALMQSQGHEVLYYENTEGGHGGAADNQQRATLQALEYSYLWQQLGHAQP
ncbi:prolyl oligopeptidase family serine peptidase [Paucibacter sp. AS339]|uniref:prolyl oligopeptidase family serine peptidase n=1 Tax=Paucibacter hankyongi TaxID=3133434 RepID=UPI0030963EC4